MSFFDNNHFTTKDGNKISLRDTLGRGDTSSISVNSHGSEDGDKHSLEIIDNKGKYHTLANGQYETKQEAEAVIKSHEKHLRDRMYDHQVGTKGTPDPLYLKQKAQRDNHKSTNSIYLSGDNV